MELPSPLLLFASPSFVEFDEVMEVAALLGVTVVLSGVTVVEAMSTSDFDLEPFDGGFGAFRYSAYGTTLESGESLASSYESGISDLKGLDIDFGINEPERW